MMLLSNGNIPLLDNKNKSNKSVEESTKVQVIEPNSKGMQSKRSSPKVRKIKKIKKKTKSKDKVKDVNKEPIKNILKFDMGDVNKGINLMELSEDDLDRGMEIITRTKKYMNKEERNILIKLESVLDLVKGIKKLNDINILSEEDESDFIEIQRNELAQHFNCVPSQINYVISTRFKPSQGYYVESKRGGGGNIKIKKITNTKSDYIMHIINNIGRTITTNDIDILLSDFLTYNIITSQEAKLLKVATSDNVLKLDKNIKDEVRARIFKNMLLNIE